MEKESSDPLPYVKVDRALHAKAIMLAQTLGVTFQHALGSLVQWWSLCGDPRELERIMASTPTDAEPEVILVQSEVQVLFRLAAGHEAPIEALVRLGLLEKRADQFRVRGMSRFFKPLAARRIKREAGKLGGAASVAARKAKTGSAQPQRRLTTAEATPEASASEAVEHVVEQPRDEPQAPPNTADSVQRSAVISLEKQAPPAPQTNSENDKSPPPKKRKHAIIDVPSTAANPTGKEFFAWAQVERTTQLGLVAEREPSTPVGSWFESALVAADVVRLRQGYRAFLEDPYWRRRNAPWSGWLSQWERYVPPAVAPPPPVDEVAAELERRLSEQLGSYSLHQVRLHATAIEWDQSDPETDPKLCRIRVVLDDLHFADWCRDHYGVEGIAYEQPKGAGS